MYHKLCTLLKCITSCVILSSMKRAREYTKIIVTRLNEELKTKFDRYCERHGISGSEAIRCYILNLPDVEEKPKQAGDSGSTGEATEARREKEAGT